MLSINSFSSCTQKERSNVSVDSSQPSTLSMSISRSSWFSGGLRDKGYFQASSFHRFSNDIRFISLLIRTTFKETGSFCLGRAGRLLAIRDGKRSLVDGTWKKTGKLLVAGMSESIVGFQLREKVNSEVGKSQTLGK